MEFLRKLSEYNLSNPDKKITWSGQYICRPQSEIPKDLYELMRDAGAEGITIGAESGSNHVLTAMNKKTTVEALYIELEQFRKHSITCVLLTFVGHWSETQDDFVEHCRMLVNIAPYVRSGTISAITLGYPYIFTDGTPALDNHSVNGIIINQSDINNIWINKNNPTNTFKERVYRRLIAQVICKKLNIPTIADFDDLLYLTNYINISHKEINDFFQANS
jgi:anaerobic magnesium-protoporphyrin IX monomethyl ester cyclase